MHFLRQRRVLTRSLSSSYLRRRLDYLKYTLVQNWERLPTLQTSAKSTAVVAGLSVDHRHSTRFFPIISPEYNSVTFTFYRHCFLDLKPSHKGRYFHHMDLHTTIRGFSGFHLLAAWFLGNWNHRTEIFPSLYRSKHYLWWLSPLKWAVPLDHHVSSNTSSVPFTFYRHSALD